MGPLLLVLTVWAWLSASVAAAKSGKLMATALVPCLDTNGITGTKFNFTFDRASGKIIYDVSVNIGVSGSVLADIELYVYGIRALTKRLDPCETAQLNELCPLSAGEIDIRGEDVLSEDVLKNIPGIAFTVPDIDAFLVAKVRDKNTNAMVACVRFEVANTKTVEETAVKWVTAVIAGLGLLVSGMLTYFGSSVTAQHISATTILMFSYFQSMVLVDMTAVERVPPMASAWTEDVAWSVGLVYTSFLEKIMRWYVQSTGGHPVTYKLYATKSVLAQKIKRRSMQAMQAVANTVNRRTITPRVQDYFGYRDTVMGAFQDALKNSPNSAVTTTGRIHDMPHIGMPEGFAETVSRVGKVAGLAKREDAAAQVAYAKSSNVLVVYRGIKRVAWDMGIEETSAVLTTFTIFGFILTCVAFFFVCMYGILSLVTRGGGSQRFPNAQYFKLRLSYIYKGTLLKLIYVAFPSIMVFSMWEWVQQDSAGVITTSAVIFVLTLGIVVFHMWKVFTIARHSIRETGTPEYLLYGDSKTLVKYGFIYAQFNSKYYYFAGVYVVYNFVKACFIAFAQASGQTQALALFIIEIAMLVLVCWRKPFLSRAANAINITMQVIITLNSMFFLFFSNLMTQPIVVNGVMGVIYFVLNAAFSVVLLLYTIIFSVICVIQRNKDAINKDHNATDDRLSFIEDQKPTYRREEAGEFAALGRAAQADHDPGASTDDGNNWFDQRESQLYDLQQPARNLYAGDKKPRSTSSMTSLNVPAVNDLNAHFGRKVDAAETNFDIGNEPTDSSTSTQSYPQKKHKWFGKR